LAHHERRSRCKPCIRWSDRTASHVHPTSTLAVDAGDNGLKDQRRVLEHCEHDHGNVRAALLEAARGSNAAVPGEMASPPPTRGTSLASRASACRSNGQSGSTSARSCAIGRTITRWAVRLSPSSPVT
jgi:hypothetical protein